MEDARDSISQRPVVTARCDLICREICFYGARIAGAGTDPPVLIDHDG